MNKTRMVTEGAFMLAIFTVLLLVSLYIPIMWILSSLFLILPFLLYSAKYPVKYSFLLIIGSVAISAIVGSLVSVPLALSYSTTGVVMGSLIRKKYGKLSIYMAGSLVFLANLIVQYVVSILFFNINFISDFSRMFEESFAQSIHMMERLGQPVPEQMERQFTETLDYIQAIMPSLLVMVSFFLVLLFILVNFPILKRLGVQVQQWKPFKEWQLPKSILWYYLLTIVAALILPPERGTTWYIAFVNLSFMLQILLFIQGLSFIYFYADIKKWPKALPIFLTIFSILFSPFLYVVRILGIIDLGFNLRQRLNQKP
ncbi:MAG TPA: YybS family protein [Chondromyces sp.]|nr:YybS family protein [Chondromyces sp.]